MESKEQLLQNIDALQNLLIDRATQNSNPDENAFSQLRRSVLEDSRIRDVVPAFLKTCRTLPQFWSFIKSQSGQWDGRREFIWNAFNPVLDAIEKLDSGPRVAEFDFKNLEPFVSTLASLLAADGAATAVAALTFGSPSIEWAEEDRFTGDIYRLYLRLPRQLYAQLAERRKEIERLIEEKLYPVLAPYREFTVQDVVIVPEISGDANWREKAQAWLTGEGVTNQGRVRSNNVAPLCCDGLLFRSQPEIFLYQALKPLGVSFAPLPVFIRGGEKYQRMEPDFLLLKDGVMMIVEVDGDTVHLETPAEAHARTTMLLHEGAFLERVSAHDCDSPDRAKQCARRLLEVLRKRKAAM